MRKTQKFDFRSNRYNKKSRLISQAAFLFQLLRSRLELVRQAQIENATELAEVETVIRHHVVTTVEGDEVALHFGLRRVGKNRRTRGIERFKFPLRQHVEQVVHVGGNREVAEEIKRQRQVRNDLRIEDGLQITRHTVLAKFRFAEIGVVQREVPAAHAI